MSLSRRIYLILAVLCFSVGLFAQTREDIRPKTFTKSASLFTDPAQISLSFDAAAQALIDHSEEKAGHAPRFARCIPTDLGLTNAGTWNTLPNGDRVWRLRISSPSALGLIPCYDAFYLPAGATFHLYTPQKDEVIGAYTSENNPEGGSYNTGLIHGDLCILEYYEPAAVRGLGRIHINEVGHAYRMVPKRAKSTPEFGSSGSCQVNAACSEGSGWVDQKNAVVRILVKIGPDLGWCTGALVNNVARDCTPYLLSADHCYQDDVTGRVTSTSDLNQWVFYFNYESATCTNPANDNGLTSHTITGCTFKAASLDTGGNSGSDFVLLKLKVSPPSSYNPYYAGWSNVNTPSGSGVSIHHPNADIKKISTYTQALTSTSWAGVAADTHWDVLWAATTHGHGVTEPGSSGSPIFDSNKRIVGTLTGGGSDCTALTDHDQYGKLSYHWTSNGATANKRLANWLDPANTGAQTLDGVYAPCTTVALDAGIESISPSGNLCNASVVISVGLRNNGTSTLTSDTLTFTIDGTPQVLRWTGSLASFATTQVSLPSQTFAPGTHTITVSSSSPNAGVDSNANNNSKTESFTVVSSTGQYSFTLHTDDFGSETSWQLTDSAANVIYSGGPYTNQANGQLINESWCLLNGCYTFTIFDASSDGLQGTNLDGNFVIQSSTGDTAAHLTNTNFGSQEVHRFCVNRSTGIEDVTATGKVAIYPNPSTGLFTVTNLHVDAVVSLFDALGREVYSGQAKSDSKTTIDLSGNSNGIYFFRIDAGEQGSVVKKVLLSTAQ